MERTIRVPLSSGRHSAASYAKLLCRVDPDADQGFGFEGSILKPGALIPLSALWPTREYPEVPLLLECAGPSRIRRGHRRQSEPDAYILWRLDLESETWRELARSYSATWTWALDLRPIALRALYPRRAEPLRVTGLAEAAELWLSFHLARLSSEERRSVLSSLHNRLCSRICAFSVGG